MKQLLIIFIILSLGLSTYYYLERPELPFPVPFIDNLPTKLEVKDIILQKFEAIKKGKPVHKEEYIKQDLEKLEKKLSPDAVIIYLKNKSIISGELTHENPKEIFIRWKDGEIGFSREEIERIEYGKETEEKEGFLFPDEEKWKYNNDIVVQLTNLTVIDAVISDVTSENVLLKFPLEEGGTIEQEIPRSRIENLLFKPVVNKRSKEIRKCLKEQFPKMHFYEESIFTICTDSNNIWVEKYQKVLRSHIRDFYFTYFRLLKGRKPKVQNFIVIFDKINDFREYATLDGVPEWAGGYFDSVDEVLYLPNFLGDEAEDLIYECLVMRNRRIANMFGDWVKDNVDQRYHIFIEGLMDEWKGKFVKLSNIALGFFRNVTYLVLRHEATHELFHSWGLQNIVMSRIKYSQEELAEKKKEYLESEDKEKRAELLSEILSQREKIEKTYIEKVEATNSWFVEGTATYSETDPLGGLNKFRLYEFQEAKRKDMLFPLEQLTVYKIGSFPGVADETMGAAYAQSWAFTHFLMNKYPDEFMSYLERMVGEKPEKNEDLEWLLGALDRKLREVEEEFLAYMDKFEQIENPDFNIKWYEYVYEEFYY